MGRKKHRLFLYYPKCRGHVTRVDVGSPLTTNHYLNTQRGESYGLAWSPERFKPEILKVLHPVTPIPGLLLTGEATLFGGFVGAMMSGFVTALKVLGWLTLLKIVLVTPAPVNTSPQQSTNCRGAQSVKIGCFVVLGAVFYSFGCNAWSIFHSV